jgi:serine protease Do
VVSFALAIALAAANAFAEPRMPKAAPEAAAVEPPLPPLSSSAERVYEMSRPKILQIRTLLQGAGRQTTIGSGFLVSADGLAITNYHVISQFALDPKTYKLEYLAPDGARGALKLLAIDVPNDLAVVGSSAPGRPTSSSIRAR